MWLDWGKVGALAAVVAAITGVVQIAQSNKGEEPPRAKKDAGARLASHDSKSQHENASRLLLPAITAVALVVVVIAVFYRFTPESSPQSQGPTPQPGSSGSMLPSSTTRPPPPPPGKIAAELTIKKSAIFQGSLPPNQIQVKLQLRIHNVSTAALNAKIENIRLLIPGDDMPGVWTPRVPTAKKSVVTLDDGKHYVAVPANQNRDCEPINAPCTTFASFWFPPDPLLPDGFYEGEGRNSGDVVYYVPPYPDGDIKVKGVALVSDDGTSVLGYQEINQDAGKDHPRDF